MIVLGIFAQGPNTAACLIVDGGLVAFAEEERFTRVKNAADTWPVRAAASCLSIAGIASSEVDRIAVGWGAEKYASTDGNSVMKHHYDAIARDFRKDTLTLQHEARLLERFRPDRVRAECARVFAEAGLSFRSDAPIQFVDHHRAHAASAFFASGFDEAAVVTMDGSGEELCTTVWAGVGTTLIPAATASIPNSLGWFYAAFTELLGFRAYRDEGKLMALAAYGRPNERLQRLVRQVCSVAPSQPLGYLVNPYYTFFGEHTLGARFTDQLAAEATEAVCGPLTRDHARRDIAFAVQQRLEEVFLSIVSKWAPALSKRLVCFAGGVCLNCKANGSISALIDSGVIDSLFIQPVANDAGTALGAGMIAALDAGDDPRFQMSSVALGPRFTGEEVRRAIEASGLPSSTLEERTSAAARLLAGGAVIGWFQGRMEVGPRALGHRSILADPRRSQSTSLVNAKMKKREPWRPFGPSVLQDSFATYFEGNGRAPFMVRAFKAHAGISSIVPAVVHIDNSVRPQAVDASCEPLFADLLIRFGELTGVPMLLNTSFNGPDEPIVCSPEDALVAFASSGLDGLVIEDCLVAHTRDDLDSWMAVARHSTTAGTR